MASMSSATVALYWIPLGAGGHCVRLNGRIYEALVAARERRRRCSLYHAALVIEVDGERYTVEIALSPDADEASRGVVGTGAVGSRRLGRLRLFRYEVRCWRGGSIPDLAYAVGGSCRMLAAAIVQDLLTIATELQHQPIPTLVLVDESSAVAPQGVVRLFGRSPTVCKRLRAGNGISAPCCSARVGGSGGRAVAGLWAGGPLNPTRRGAARRSGPWRPRSGRRAARGAC
jgi:hypothetical protein